MADYTLTYSEGAEGFPSFYTFYPDWMIGMNTYFYSFNGGNLFRHNVNPTRNEYYGQPGTSSITGVFNKEPLMNKIFKTIQLESDDKWTATFASDLQTGEIQEDWLEKKESDWFGFIRYFDPEPAANTQFNLRSVSGIGRMISVVNVVGTTYLITFDAEVGTQISDGDVFYQIDTTVPPPPPIIPVMCGTVIAHTATTVTVDIATPVGSVAPTAPGGPPPAPFTNLGCYVKNALAESYGVLGHYMEFTLTNNNTEPVELFSVLSDVMRSYP